MRRCHVGITFSKTLFSIKCMIISHPPRSPLTLFILRFKQSHTWNWYQNLFWLGYFYQGCQFLADDSSCISVVDITGKNCPEVSPGNKSDKWNGRLFAVWQSGNQLFRISQRQVVSLVIGLIVKYGDCPKWMKLQVLETYSFLQK